MPSATSKTIRAFDEDARCSDIRDTCALGSALRRGEDPALVLAQALDVTLYRGIRPSIEPLLRAEAVAILLDQHCDAHRAEAATILAALSPGPGLPRRRPTPPPRTRFY